MRLKELEAELEATRQKLADQGRVVDARLLDKERVLEQVIDRGNKWRGILQELAQRCPPDRWADDHEEGPWCALMQLHAISVREGHCIPIDEFLIETKTRDIGARPMRLKELEAELEATRQKISEQLSMVGESIQSIDPTLYDKERVLEQVIDMWRDKFDTIAEPDEPMSINKWRGILQEQEQALADAHTDAEMVVMIEDIAYAFLENKGNLTNYWKTYNLNEREQRDVRQYLDARMRERNDAHLDAPVKLQDLLTEYKD
jgi:uncharacterized protein YhaN